MSERVPCGLSSRGRFAACLAVLLWCLPSPAQASGAERTRSAPLPAGGAPRHAEPLACLRAAARHHGVDVRLLHAIAEVESGLRAHAINRQNRNGSRDIGLMQINSGWLPVLARHGVRERDLYDPCVSAHVGAWILADNIARHGPVWRAVGAYNAASRPRQVAYVRKVQAALAAQARRAGLSGAGPSRGSGLAVR